MQTEKQFATARQAMLESVNELVIELHQEGFSSLWIESFHLGVDRHFYQRVVIDREDVGEDMIEQLQTIAHKHDGRIALIEVKLGRLGAHRLAIWPGKS